MTQAYYAPENFGHFGLTLPRYAHFTSPIRRYADLVVHRALIRAHRWGDGRADRPPTRPTWTRPASTSRRPSAARCWPSATPPTATSRPSCADRVGTEFEGASSGVARFGLFVKLDETGADGLVPISTLGREYFRLRRRQPDPDRREVAPRHRPGAARRPCGSPKRRRSPAGCSSSCSRSRAAACRRRRAAPPGAGRGASSRRAALASAEFQARPLTTGEARHALRDRPASLARLSLRLRRGTAAITGEETPPCETLSASRPR